MGGQVLGMPGLWAENYVEKSDHYTTKIGGLPDWPIPDMFTNSDLTKCVLCGDRLYLLTQIYAPIKTPKSTVDERVLYVFVCLKPTCGSNPKCWRALRLQKCNVDKLFNAICRNSKLLENCNGEGKNMSYSCHDSVDENLTIDNGESDDDAYGDVDFDKLARELSEASCQASMLKKLTETVIVEASRKSLHSSLILNDLNSSIPVLPCFYVYHQEVRPLGNVCANYALLSIKHEDDSCNDQNGEEDWDGEGYEYDMALGADRTYLKFKKQLDTFPEQCFRYSYGGKPLLVRTNLVECKPCSLCGSSRQYEMQLMPPLLYFLHEAADSSSVRLPEECNWMTLIVYTCSSNCCPRSYTDQLGSCYWTMVEEAIVIQEE